MNKKITLSRRARNIILISVVLVVVIIVIFARPIPEKVRKYDNVQIEYTMWESDERMLYSYSDPIFNETLWVRMIPITKNQTDGLILGLYNNLLGKELHYKSDIIWLDKSIDQDRDGIDDITNKPALTYGNSTDVYFNTPLMIQFKVLDIQKTPESPGILHAVSHIFYVIFLIVLSLFLMSIPIFAALLIDYLYRTPIDVKKVLRYILKYGILVGVLTAIPFIVFDILLSQLTLSGLNLIKAEYWWFMPSVYVVIGIIWVFISWIYLVIYKAIEGKIKLRRKYLFES